MASIQLFGSNPLVHSFLSAANRLMELQSQATWSKRVNGLTPGVRNLRRNKIRHITDQNDCPQIHHRGNSLNTTATSELSKLEIRKKRYIIFSNLDVIIPWDLGVKSLVVTHVNNRGMSISNRYRPPL